MDIHHLPSQFLKTSRQITVLAPARRAGAARFPLLLLNDGQNLFDPARAFAGATWGVAETVAHLVRTRAIPPLIVVGIDHGGSRRSREYLPVPDDRNPEARNPLGRKYAEFIAREVVPFVTARYPVAAGAANRGFGGSSYGAVAALFTSLQKPGLFGRLLLESPSLYVGNGYLLRRARQAERWPSRIYLGVGTKEAGNAERDIETVVNVQRLAGILRQAGLGPKRLKTVIAEDATHSEGAWAARLPNALTFLFGER